jgi:hypothetical protein
VAEKCGEGFESLFNLKWGGVQQYCQIEEEHIVMPVKNNGITISDERLTAIEELKPPEARRLKGGGGGGGGRARSKAKARKKCVRDPNGEGSLIKKAVEAVTMSRLNKKMICGRQGGLPFN